MLITRFYSIRYGRCDMSKEASIPKRSLWKNIFISPNEPRLRAGWRLAIQTILMLALMVILGIPAEIIASLAPQNSSDALFIILNVGVELVAFAGSIYLARRFLDRRSFGSLGFKLDRRVLPDLLAGIAITFVMMGLIYVAMRSLGWIRFNGFAWQSDPLPVVLGQLVLFFVLFTVVGWQEELLFRGYQLQTIASGMNLFWGVILSSAIFGALHLTNPNATWVSAAGIFFAGLFLAQGYLRTGQLWLSIGLHIGWNFFEGVVFGFPVSGIASYQLLRITASGPERWTGGAFGPEAGLIVLPALAVGAGLIYLYTKLRGNSSPQT
jgi:uncharacterized protein